MDRKSIKAEAKKIIKDNLFTFFIGNLLPFLFIALQIFIYIIILNITDRENINTILNTIVIVGAGINLIFIPVLICFSEYYTLFAVRKKRNNEKINFVDILKSFRKGFLICFLIFVASYIGQLTLIYIFIWAYFGYDMLVFVANDNPKMKFIQLLKQSSKIRQGKIGEAIVFYLSFCGWFLLISIVAGLISSMAVIPVIGLIAIISIILLFILLLTYINVAKVLYYEKMCMDVGFNYSLEQNDNNSFVSNSCIQSQTVQYKQDVNQTIGGQNQNCFSNNVGAMQNVTEHTSITQVPVNSEMLGESVICEPINQASIQTDYNQNYVIDNQIEIMNFDDNIPSNIQTKNVQSKVDSLSVKNDSQFGKFITMPAVEKNESVVQNNNMNVFSSNISQDNVQNIQQNSYNAMMNQNIQQDVSNNLDNKSDNNII